MSSNGKKPIGEIFAELEPKGLSGAEFAFNSQAIQKRVGEAEDKECIDWMRENPLSPIHRSVVMHISWLLDLQYMTNEQKIALGFEFNDHSFWTGVLQQHVDFSEWTNVDIIALTEKIYKGLVEDFQKKSEAHGQECTIGLARNFVESHCNDAWMATAKKLHLDGVPLEQQIDFALECGNPDVVRYILSDPIPRQAFVRTSKIPSFSAEEQMKLKERVFASFLKRYGLEDQGDERKNYDSFKDGRPAQVLNFLFGGFY